MSISDCCFIWHIFVVQDAALEDSFDLYSNLSDPKTTFPNSHRGTFDIGKSLKLFCFSWWNWSLSSKTIFKVYFIACYECPLISELLMAYDTVMFFFWCSMKEHFDSSTKCSLSWCGVVNMWHAELFLCCWCRSDSWALCVYFG